LDIRKNFFTESGQALEQAAQGGGGVTIPGGVCGTSGHGLVGVLVTAGLGDLRGLFQPMIL